MSDIVRYYYDENAEKEWTRLTNPYNAVEFRSTLRMLERYLPRSGRVVDIGSGPGRYSIELLRKGYRVTLMDISAKELELAKLQIRERGFTADDYICADARGMDRLEDNAYDAVLIMGPLYHVLEQTERKKILTETRRILKPGGVAFFTYINSWGALKAGVCEYAEEYRNINRLYAYLQEQHLDASAGFTECYFTTPPQAISEINSAGFELVSYGGVEGFLGGMRTEVTRLYAEDREAYNNLLQVAVETCEHPAFRDATEHLILAAKNPMER